MAWRDARIAIAAISVVGYARNSLARAVTLDPALLSPTDVSFDTFFGDETSFEALTAFSFGFNFADATEVSLPSNSDLDALQSPRVPLATFNFVALSDGVAQFQYFEGPVDD